MINQPTARLPQQRGRFLGCLLLYFYSFPQTFATAHSASQARPWLNPLASSNFIPTLLKSNGAQSGCWISRTMIRKNELKRRQS
ncbi:hypothetical protein BDP81DRAFT_418557 [Colletotrichum phormii]|uniref:Secreted protein n=1 Tax=Colletotrichum phormii TaxID=359342 RepID=A0AAI9ZZV2_9PEZI|nr:uncharacterized protein BDP81DRAFT_418557 [Colletotrichum phormii]KAK1641300.1 hypothetical protein BDP81DRAFT_418557 [Colletotrichum phormii]